MVYTMLQITKKRPAAANGRQRAYNHIRKKLMAGSLPAGARLSPTILAREIGISHIPVREAISQLQSEGLVVHTPNRGAFVRHIARHELVDLFEMRSIVECRAVALAARRISPLQLDDLKASLDALGRLSKAFSLTSGNSADSYELYQQWQFADAAFHMTLMSGARNRYVMRVVDELRIMSQIFGQRADPPAAWANPARFWQESFHLHINIYEAVARRDAKAAYRAALEHMRKARKNALSRFDWLRRHRDELDGSITKEFPDSMRQTIMAIQQRKFDGASSLSGDLSGNK
jgi:DNA-binding GntR family transcriptional regulator